MNELSLQKKVFIVIEMLMRCNNMKWKDLADATGLTNGMISKLKKGESRLFLEHLEKIAQALDITVTDIVKMAEAFEPISKKHS